MLFFAFFFYLTGGESDEGGGEDELGQHLDVFLLGEIKREKHCKFQTLFFRFRHTHLYFVCTLTDAPCASPPLFYTPRCVRMRVYAFLAYGPDLCCRCVSPPPPTPLPVPVSPPPPFAYKKREIPTKPVLSLPNTATIFI